MKYVLLIYNNEKAWDSIPQAEQGQLFGEYVQLGADLKAAGTYFAGEALQPTSTATTVRVRNGKAQTTDGPFAEAREHLGGFYMIEAANLDEAVKVAARIPDARIGDGAIEVRPVMVFDNMPT